MAIVFDPNKDVPDALGQITDAIAGFIQPYKKQELALRELMTKDPTLAQKLSDMAHLSPGSISGFAGPDAEAYFLGIDPTPETKARIAARSATDEALKNPDVLKYTGTRESVGATPGQVQQDKLTGTIAELTGQKLSENPDLAENAVAKKATGSLAGTGAKQMAQARYLQSVPKLNELQARGVLQTEFQKHLMSQPSEFTADMLNAAMDLPIGKTLILPFVEAQKNARMREIVGARFAQGDKNNSQSLDKIVLANAMKHYGNSKTNALIGDFVKLLGGSEELITQYGGSSPEGVVLAKQAIDANAENKDNDLAAMESIRRNTMLLEQAKTEGGKLAALQNIKEAALKLTVPVLYDLDNKGKLIRITSDATPTQETQTRNVTNTAVPQSAQKSDVSGGGTSKSSSTSGSVTKSTTKGTKTFVPSDRIKAIKAKKLTVKQYKSSTVFQALTPEEQAFILSGTK